MIIPNFRLQISDFKNRYLNFCRTSVKKAAVFHLIFIVPVFSLLVYAAFLKAPSDFPEEALFTVTSGQNLSEISKELQEQNIVKSAFWFRNTVIFLKGESGIKAGDYFFESPKNSYTVAKRMISGTLNLYPLKITIHEGLNVFEIADLLESQLPKFDKGEFLKLAKEKEGYLFPDTYFIAPNTKAESVIAIMESNFWRKIDGLSEKIQSNGKTLEEIISLASIIETEARDAESRRVISGILWKRLKIGMPLQVDVTFKYVNGKNTYQLSPEDLKIDSPYNTYLYKGLPPTPIANPGFDSILAATEPKETGYLYFLSDKKGNMYYAESHDEHIKNKRLYLYN